MSEPEKKRLKLEIGDVPIQEDGLLQQVLEYKRNQLDLVGQLYRSSQSELFYLENEGDILSYPVWCNQPNSSLDAYLSSKALPVIREARTPKVEPVGTPVPLRVPPKIPGSSGPGRPSLQSPEQLAERARHEAGVMQRIAELQREGLWAERRLPKVAEPQRLKSHWDYLLEEVHWLAADFVQERKWKMASARKCARMVQKYFQDKEQAALKAEKEQEQKLRKIASFVAKEIRQFWCNVEKLSEYKQNLLLEEKRKQMLSQHLNLIVKQTEEFSSQLAETMQGKPPETPPPSKRESDIEFEPDEGSTDDEETIEKEEKDLDVSHVAEEIDNLKKESEIPLEDLLGSLPADYFETKVPTPAQSDEESDAEFEADASSEDDEATLNEQEENEGDVTDHRTEIAELEAEQNLPIEELLKKYGHEPLRDDVEPQIESDAESSVSDSESKIIEDMINEHPSEEASEKKDDVGLEALLGLDDGDENTKERRNKLSEAVELAETFQPKGNTLASAEINVKVPFLLKHTLREYQMIGLNWLATMYERQLNGILADEMGLGKTIQTISLLAWLACEKGIWGPHLIIVPTSVMLNWEMECKKWCPALKVLTYYGSGKERKLKRTGWTKPNAFHVCITSYKLVVQDHAAFRRKQWQYIILDEAQNIKNFKSQRWQLLLNFQSQRRLLLTGTPLQNNLMELWSLMHFLMPSMFSSHKDFREWFSNPVTGMIEGNTEYNEGIIKRLHKVLRPFLLRRLKSEVEKQLPSKYEHVVMCRLSKRQRYLYDDYMSRAKTRETLSAGNLLSVINVLMQLRKVCAHPNLFEPRPTVSPFQMEGIVFSTASCVINCLDYDPFKHVNLGALNLLFAQLEASLTAFAAHRFKRSQAPLNIIQGLDNLPPLPPRCPSGKIKLIIKPQQPAGQSVMVPRPGITGYRPVQPSQPLGVRIATPQPLHASTAPILPSPPIVSPGGAGLTARQPVIPPSVGPARTNGHLLQIAPTSGQAGNGEQRTGVSTTPGSSLPSTPIRIVTTLNRQSSASDSPVPDDKPKPHVNGEEKPTAPPKPFVDPALQYDKISLARGNYLELQKRAERKERLIFLAKLNKQKCDACPVYGQDLVSHVTASAAVDKPAPSLHYTDQPWTVSSIVNIQNAIALRGMNPKGFWSRTRRLEELVKTPEELMAELNDLIARYAFVVPPAMAPSVKLHASHIPPSRLWEEQRRDFIVRNELQKPATILHTPASAMITQFPDPRLIQYDCGKLQVLDRLLRDLKVGKHRVLIFTQMTRMLDVLESFLTFHGHTYLRLDGATRIDQRQALMERFNSDKRIFCFILSTRSGGIGVNLTGADTVVFYDSDWNPTMDAQAQDRCHRIGQTRDVHIYRLISEKTIEENILKKANQKRLLGDLAIEGGNFTTAYFQKQTIRDLFDVDVNETDVAKRMAPQRQVMSVSTADVTAQQAPEPTDKVAVSAWESALQAAEDETDVMAAKNLRAEVAAELTEFDENAPVEDEEPKSKAELELQGLISQLTPVEQYALRFIETDTRVADQLAQAEEEMEERKRQWELSRAEAAKKANQKEEVITYPRAEQLVFDHFGAPMPTWAPPTPPHGDDEYYFDHSLALLYAPTFISESQLPPLEPMKEVKVPAKVVASLPLEESVVVKDEAKNRIPKVRKDEVVSAPKSLFERPNPALNKMKRDIKLARLGPRPMISAQFGGNIGGLGHIRSDEADQLPEWQIHEDMALLNAVQNIQGLPLNLQVFTPALSPNWDLVADMVNMCSVTYRSPKECKVRYFNVVVPREEGRFLPGDISPKKFKKHKLVVKVNQNVKNTRPMRTAALFQVDNNQSFTSQYNKKYEILKSVANRRAPTTRPLLSASGTNRNPKHAQLFQENGVFYDGPMSALQIAAIKAERVAKEKARAQSAAELAASAAPARAASLQPSPQQSPNLQPAAPQQQTISVPQAAAATPKPQGNSVVVSVANLTPAQVQAAAQLIAGLNTMSTSKAGTTTVSARSLTPAQLQLLRAKQLQRATVAQTTTATTTTTYVAVQSAGTSGTQRVVTLPGAQGKQHLVLTKPGQGVTRTIVADPEVAALLKRQQAIQAQKIATQNQVVIADASASTSGAQPQSYLTQVGTAGTPTGQLGSLLKTQTVPAASLSGATLTIPVSALSTVSQIPQVRSQTVGLVRAATVGASPRQITIQQPFVQNKRPPLPRTQTAQAVGIRGSTSSIQLGVQFPQGAQRVPVSMLQQVVRAPRVTLQPRSGQQPVRQTIQLVAAPSLRAAAPNVTVDQSGRFATSVATSVRTSAPTLQAVVSPKPQTPPSAPATQEIRLTIPPAQKPDDPGAGGT